MGFADLLRRRQHVAVVAENLDDVARRDAERPGDGSQLSGGPVEQVQQDGGDEDVAGVFPPDLELPRGGPGGAGAPCGE